MRLADLVLRQGHLSERSIIDAVMTGDRPAHLDRCDICAGRAVDLGRWLDDVQVLGTEAADAAFPPDHLAAQQAQILRRLEQLDEPSRVISFPRYGRRLDDSGTGGRRVAASWVAVAAAAGLVVGVLSGQWTARIGTGPANTAALSADSQTPTPAGRPVDASLLLDDDDHLQATPLDPLGDIVPRTVQASARIGG